MQKDSGPRTSLVNPGSRVANAHNAAQTTIKGCRLPKRDLGLSANMPSEFGRQSDGETGLSWARRCDQRVVVRRIRWL